MARDNGQAVSEGRSGGRAGTADLKGRSVRSGVVALAGQALAFVLQTGTMIVLARLLSPADFGIQGMVVAVTGFVGLFKDAGLGIASIQREVLGHEEASTLFWINVAVGAILTAAVAAAGPLLVTLYREPRLLAVAAVSASAFFFNGLAVQHRALLVRGMQFGTIAGIDLLALAAGAAVAIAMAGQGAGYWALVGMAVAGPLTTAGAAWMAMPWRPGRPTRGPGVRSMLHIGGTVTLNNVVVYIAYNAEKILLGRAWGAEALGLYGRAYQLANLPVQQVNSSIGSVAYPALARTQGDAARLREAFLQGYAVVISLTIPISICCGLFAEEIVRVLLGPRWLEAAPVLRLLAPMALSFALINPFGWFLQATGRAGRSLNIALLIAPVVIAGIMAGLRNGPFGVAMGYSTAMILLVIPIVAWAKRGTGMTARDYWESIKPALAAGVMAGVAGWLWKVSCVDILVAPLLLSSGVAVSLAVYVWVLLVVMGQRRLYTELLGRALGSRRVGSGE